MARLRNGPLPTVTFDGVSLSYCNNVKNLGLHIQNNLSWELQVSEVSRKIYASMHGLKRLQNFLPYSTKVTLVNSLLLPIIDYADVCYPDLTEELLDKLDRLLNLCIRYIFGLRKYDHVSTSHTIAYKAIAVHWNFKSKVRLYYLQKQNNQLNWYS